MKDQRTIKIIAAVLNHEASDGTTEEALIAEMEERDKIAPEEIRRVIKNMIAGGRIRKKGSTLYFIK